MGVEVTWSNEAETTFAKNILYLETHWSDKEVARFVRQTEQAISKIQEFPECYPPGAALH
jgi:plasmid stabilization system protein ParE